MKFLAELCIAIQIDDDIPTCGQLGSGSFQTSPFLFIKPSERSLSGNVPIISSEIKHPPCWQIRLPSVIIKLSDNH